MTVPTLKSQLDFIQLRGITNRVNEAFEQCAGDFYHVGLLFYSFAEIH
jgi:hypothetical protein